MSEAQKDPYADHWRKLFPPTDYLAWHEFKGRDVVLTIKSVSVQDLPVEGSSDKERKPVLIFEETPKKLVLNKTNARTMAGLFGQKTSAWIGKRVTLYPDPGVRAFGKVVGGIRVREKVPA